MVKMNRERTNEWHDFDNDKPSQSGYYIVEDRKGRNFRTWYEDTIKGFDMMHEGTGYKIMKWRCEDETYSI